MRIGWLEVHWQRVGRKERSKGLVSTQRDNIQTIDTQGKGKQDQQSADREMEQVSGRLPFVHLCPRQTLVQGSVHLDIIHLNADDCQAYASERPYPACTRSMRSLHFIDRVKPESVRVKGNASVVPC